MVKNGTSENLSEAQLADINKAAELIYNSFAWHLTSEGDGYWSKVHDVLIEMSTSKPYCPTCGQETQ